MDHVASVPSATSGRMRPEAVALAALLHVAAAVYHAVPWQLVQQEALRHDISAPGLLGILLPLPLRVAIVAGAAVALANKNARVLWVLLARNEDYRLPAAA